MTTKQLEDEAWSLIVAARATIHLKRRRFLIAEAYELIKAARAVKEGEPSATEPPQGTYRLLFSRADRAILWIDLNSMSRADALWAADALASACVEEFEAFELWQGTRLLFGDETRLSRFSLETGIEVTLASQRSVLETEETLLRTHRALSRSRKLLARTRELRQALT
jgi:hypothetical protein